MISNFKKIFFLIFLTTSITFNVFADNKIVYVDMDLVLSNTNIGKKVFEKLSINENKKKEEFSNKEKKLKDEENKILASRNIISEEQLNINIKEFQNTLRNYRNFKLRLTLKRNQRTIYQS